MADLRTPLTRARGLGSAKEGTHHWMAQRISAIALVGLTIWFAYALIRLAGADYVQTLAFLSSPIQSTLLILTVGAGFWHAALGLQVVIEDYVHDEGVKLALVFAVKLGAAALSVLATVCILKVAFGA